MNEQRRAVHPEVVGGIWAGSGDLTGSAGREHGVAAGDGRAPRVECTRRLRDHPQLRDARSTGERGRPTHRAGRPHDFAIAKRDAGGRTSRDMKKTTMPLFLAAVVMAGCATVKVEKEEVTVNTVPAAKGSAPVAALGAPGSRLGKVDSEGFTVIFDGTWDGWLVNERPDSWKIADGALRASGERSHCFYIGALAPFKDFELKLDILTEPGSNGGVYIHTKYQDSGWPWGGYETQVNQTQGDWRKSGSVYSVQDVKEIHVKDQQWYTHHVVVKGDTVRIYLDGKLVNEFKEEAGRKPGKDFERKLNQGTIAFQAHDPKSVVYYKNVRVKKL